MADMDEALVQDANFSTDQHFPSSECAYQQAESPGTKRLQDLATTELEFDEPEVSAKLMERPISSGSAELQGYTYGAAPKRDLQIAKKPATALFGVSNSKLRARPPTRESPVEHGSALQADRERR